MPTTYIFICNRKPPDHRGQLYNVHTYFFLERGIGGGGEVYVHYLGRAENYIREGNIEEVNNGYVIFKRNIGKEDRTIRQPYAIVDFIPPSQGL